MSNFLLRFQQLDDAIELSKRYVRSIKILDHAMFMRIYNSLTPKDNNLIVFDENYSRQSTDILVCNLPNLPFDNKTLLNTLYKKLSINISSNLDVSSSIDKSIQDIRKSIWSIAAMRNADYSISESIDILKLMKLFDIKPLHAVDTSLLDSCISFIDFVHDISSETIVCFMMPDIFLDENDYQQLINHVIFSEMPVLMINYGTFNTIHENERQTVIDQQLWLIND